MWRPWAPHHKDYSRTKEEISELVLPLGGSDPTLVLERFLVNDDSLNNKTEIKGSQYNNNVQNLVELWANESKYQRNYWSAKLILIYFK